MATKKQFDFIATNDTDEKNKHSIMMNVGSVLLPKLPAAVKFEIKDAEQKLGTLSVSRGGLRWTPATGSGRGKTLPLPWPRVAKMLGKLNVERIVTRSKNLKTKAKKEKATARA
jgi:hypothetical protein